MDTSQKKPVGYRKPPKHSQFKPGQSGNPNGRPKGSKNLSSILAEELDVKVPVTENGKRLKVSKSRLAIRQQVNKSVLGDSKAFQTLAKFQQTLEPGQRLSGEAPSLPASEITIEQCFEALRQWYGQQQTGPASEVEALATVPTDHDGDQP